MAPAVALGGEVYGDTMVRRGGEDKPMKIARTKSGMENAADKPTKMARITSEMEAGVDKHTTKIVRTISGMEGGEGEFSYTRNSAVQSQSLNILTPILEQEIKELELFKDWSGSAIRVADFGCSVGANTLGYAEICYRIVCQARESNGTKSPDEVQYFFCDLPSNDFNTLFLQVENWRKTQVTSMDDFLFTAVSGSFHRRLLPKRSLHVAISTLAVHWMSQVPDAVLDKSSPAYNKGRVWIDDNKNVATLQAFKQTARQDLRKFMLARAEEVVPGGLVLIYAMGCPDARHPEIQWARDGEYAGPYSKVFEATWEELVTEVFSCSTQVNL